MSLLSLKKSQPSTNLSVHNVDEFIDDAVHYAFGNIRKNDVEAINSDELEATVPAPPIKNTHVKSTAMKHATFTLSPESISKLASVSELTGISRSRLLRIWIDTHAHKDTEMLLSSPVL